MNAFRSAELVISRNSRAPTREVALEDAGRLARDDIDKEQVFHFTGELIEQVAWKVTAGEQQDQVLAGRPATE